MQYDTVIVGAGVVGLACAQRLSRSGRSVLVLERHAAFGQETSSRNSEVIHAGTYYARGSLKAELCVAGNAALYAWCERLGVNHARLGKYIIATCAEEEAELAALLERGRSNGVAGLRLVSSNELKQAEPRVRATAGLWSPNTGIIDSHGFMASLLQSAREHDCDMAWRHALVAVTRSGDRYRLTVRAPDGEELQVTASSVVNAAGLDSDVVAAMAGIDIDEAGYRLTYVKGHYFRIRGAAPARHLIYPVPPAKLLGLGIHVTLDLSGRARLGPDVEVLAQREQRYDVPESLAPKFLAAASRYLTGLALEDLSPDQAGIRPRVRGDFVIVEESARGLPGWVNLIGIESPGLTCALPIAERVERLLNGAEQPGPAQSGS